MGERGTPHGPLSTDVAALALGLARSSAPALIEGCDARLREHLRALPAPAENFGTLAEILGEDLEPSGRRRGWLVIDDYHEVAQEPKAESFVAALVAARPIQLVIASRQRPAWVSMERILYGDVLELGQTALAMDLRRQPTSWSVGEPPRRPGWSPWQMAGRP